MNRVASTAVLLAVPAGSANAATPDTKCMQAGIATLKSAGLFSQVARSGLPIATAVSWV